jgi:hypothetical protein
MLKLLQPRASRVTPHEHARGKYISVAIRAAGSRSRSGSRGFLLGCFAVQVLGPAFRPKSGEHKTDRNS